MPFDKLPEDAKEQNKQSVIGPIKDMLSCGYHIRKKVADRRSTTTIIEDGGITYDTHPERFGFREDIWKAFSIFSEGRHEMHNTDIIPALHALGWAVGTCDAANIILQMDPNGDGQVDPFPSPY